MSINRPEDMFEELAAALNAGDVDRALALYEPDAGFITAQGDLARGNAGLRAEFQAIVAAKATMIGEAVKTIVVKDLALVFVRYSATMPGPDGKTLEFGGLSTDVLRQQGDGSWLSVIDNPYGAAFAEGQAMPQEILDATSH
jgi:uncharacterized protein (TIGR02246 family)